MTSIGARELLRRGMLDLVQQEFRSLRSDMLEAVNEIPKPASIPFAGLSPLTQAQPSGRFQVGSVMKKILLLIGAVTLLGAVGCSWDHDRDHRGGAYDRSYGEYPYRSSGHGEYLPFDHPYDRDRDWH